MKWVYDLFISFYGIAARITALFNKKARLWVEGRKGIMGHLQEAFKGNMQPVAWFHCASLGEFEQARPLIEGFRKEFPAYKILLTFFSPSGYEIRKNYTGADDVFYLPEDSNENARQFVQIVKPAIAFFTKYEFWYHFLHALKSHRAHILSFSSIFRKEQVFFQPYGKFYLGFLRCFDQLYVQDEFSQKILGEYGIYQVKVSGDTRFDRVAEHMGSARSLPLIQLFKGDATILIIGSSWNADLEVLKNVIQHHPEIKVIIAPHEIHESNLNFIENLFPLQTLRFSEANEKTIINSKILIIDNIGMLSSLYQYGNLAYIGGGFGKGIHNLLEAAAFGLPVVFGPNHQRFREAIELIQNGAGFAVSNKDDCTLIMNKLLSDKKALVSNGEKAREYVISRTGATRKILDDCHIFIEEQLMKGTILRSTGSWYEILPEDHSQVYKGRLRGKFKIKDLKVTNPIAVGDEVEFVPEDGEQRTAVIQTISPRKNYFIRQSVQRAAFGHLIAANLDQTILIATLKQPRTSLGFIDRFLVSAEAFRIPAVILFNKADLYNEEEYAILEEVQDIYGQLGYRTIAVSALEGTGLDQVKSLIDNQRSLFSGHSGVGKSTLINHLIPGLNLRTQEISDFASKGVHTTTFAEMFEPWPGTQIIDTPGIKELGLFEITKEELSHFFPEMRELLGACKFQDCLHVNEPKCAVKDKVESGEIPESRYRSYLSMLFNEDSHR